MIDPVKVKSYCFDTKLVSVEATSRFSPFKVTQAEWSEKEPPAVGVMVIVSDGNLQFWS